jgi:hypothetical protein
MKALTVTQPWATLIALGEKHIETRSWLTRYRGEVAIHASKAFPQECKDLCDTPPFREVLRSHNLGVSDLPRGAILCVSSIKDCLRSERIASASGSYSESAHELAFGNYTTGRYSFLLGFAMRLATPIYIRGSLGLWEWSAPDWESLPFANGGIVKGPNTIIGEHCCDMGVMFPDMFRSKS